MFANGLKRRAACSRWTVLLALVLAACALSAPVCSAITCPRPTYTTWKGGPGSWSDSTKWTNGIPWKYTIASIDGGNPVASPVTVDISDARAHILTIDSDDSLSINNGSSLSIVYNGGFYGLCSGSLSNYGKIVLNSTGTATSLGGIFAYLSNYGTISLTDSTNPQNFIQGNWRATLNNNGLIQGAGSITIRDITNNGTILANASHALSIQPGGSVTNNGTLQVASGSLMHVFGGSFTNFSGSTLTGGTYNISGKLEIDQLGSTGGEIVTNAASIILNGAASSFVDAAGNNALSKFATNAAAGSFSLQGGRAFTTAGNLSNAGTFTIGSGSTFTVGGTGTKFTQTAGTTTDDGTLAVPSSGSLSLNAGSLFGKGAITGAVTSSGTITPGDSLTATGILKDTGKYTQSSAGALDISIDGTTAGTQYDQLNPTKASLNGTLNINLINGFVPAIGNTFKIVNFTSESGTFATVNGLAINSSEHFTITYQGSDVLLTVVSGPCCASQSPSARFKASLFGGLAHPTSGEVWSGRLGLGGVRETPFVPARGRAQEAPLQVGRNFPHLSLPSDALAQEGSRVFSIAAFVSPRAGQRPAFRPAPNLSVGTAPHSVLGGSANSAIRNRINPLAALLGNNGHAQRMMAPKSVAYHLDLLSILGTSPTHLWRGFLGQPGSPSAANFGYLTFQ